MRKLIMDDIQRFSTMVETAGVREIISDGLKQAAEEGIKKRNVLLKLKRQLDEAQNTVQRDDIMRQLMTTQKDDAWLYIIGIDVVMQVLSAAAKRHAMDCVYAFLSPVLEMDASSLAELPLNELAPLLRQLILENNFKDFFDLPGLTQAK